MERQTPTDRPRLARAAIAVSIVAHLVGLQGLRCSARPPRTRTPPTFAIDIAPPPPKAEALAPEREDTPAAIAAARPT